MSASAISDFRKTDFWATGHQLGLPIFHLGTKFGAKMLIDAKIMAQNRNPRWRPFVTLSHRTIHEVFSLGHIGLSNFMLIRCIVLKIWRFDFFADLTWNAYSRPQNFGFWGSEPLNLIGHHQEPQNAHHWLELHLHANFGTDRSNGATSAQDEEIKKKARKETYSGKLGVRPDHTRWRSDMWSCMPGGLLEML